MREAACAGAPSTQNRSLIPSGMPQRSGASPASSRASAARRLVARELRGRAPRTRSAPRPPRPPRGRPRSARPRRSRPRAAASRASAIVRRGELAPSTRRPSARRRTRPRASGALASTRSGSPPSVTTSCAPRQPHRRHRGHRLDPVDIDLAQLLHEAEDRRQLGRQRPEIGLRHLDPGEMRHAARGLLVDRHSAGSGSGLQARLIARPAGAQGPQARRPSGLQGGLEAAEPGQANSCGGGLWAGSSPNRSGGPGSEPAMIASAGTLPRKSGLVALLEDFPWWKTRATCSGPSPTATTARTSGRGGAHPSPPATDRLPAGPVAGSLGGTRLPRSPCLTTARLAWIWSPAPQPCDPRPASVASDRTSASTEARVSASWIAGEGLVQLAELVAARGAVRDAVRPAGAARSMPSKKWPAAPRGSRRSGRAARRRSGWSPSRTSGSARRSGPGGVRAGPG